MASLILQVLRSFYIRIRFFRMSDGHGWNRGGTTSSDVYIVFNETDMLTAVNKRMCFFCFDCELSFFYI